MEICVDIRPQRTQCRRAYQKTSLALRHEIERNSDHYSCSSVSTWHSTLHYNVPIARVAELADAPDLGSGGREAVGVRVPPFAPSHPSRTTRVPPVTLLTLADYKL